MYAKYENPEKEFSVYRRKSAHHPPHITGALECIYVTDGTLELGINQDLFHMEAGDFAAVFPDMIHHYQVFTPGKNYAVHLVASPLLSGGLLSTLQNFCPVDPVIKKENVHPDIVYVMTHNLKEEATKYSDFVHQAGVQIILGRALPLYKLTDKSSTESDDLIDRTVSYIAKHFTENISLTKMADDLYVSQYTLSRIFSGTFHTNFNRYLNTTRLRYAVHLMKYTDQTITEAAMNSGFESQRTFNRAFSEVYRMSPSEYRKTMLTDEE